MSSDPTLDLETFVQQFFTSRGADIDKKGGRLDVLAPRELARRIGIPDLCSLKIGSEDPDGYGVHYGSPLLEKIAEIACDTVPLTIVRLAFHYIKSQGFDRLIQELFTFRGAVVRVKNTATVKTEYLLLTCRFLAQSDEQKEGLVPLAFNLETGAPAGGIEAMLDTTEKKYETGRLGAAFEEEKMRMITQWVRRQAPKILEAQIESFRDSMNRRFRRDVANLEEYYAELKQEMTENLMRSGLSEQLIQERKEKIGLIPDEMAKKKDDLFKKYSIKVKLKLSGSMLIRTPAVKLFCGQRCPLCA
ncbi:MAG: hypothetical protein HGJ93_15685 [Desulfosarcina sp.]|nr:hypothetical protein [Desulfosarcina sp.]MBC2767341.1 hypothetical protein [Desulfosarcina sp.]